MWTWVAVRLQGGVGVVRVRHVETCIRAPSFSTAVATMECRDTPYTMISLFEGKLQLTGICDPAR